MRQVAVAAIATLGGAWAGYGMTDASWLASAILGGGLLVAWVVTIAIVRQVIEKLDIGLRVVGVGHKLRGRPSAGGLFNERWTKRFQFLAAMATAAVALATALLAVALTVPTTWHFAGGTHWAVGLLRGTLTALILAIIAPWSFESARHAGRLRRG